MVEHAGINCNNITLLLFLIRLRLHIDLVGNDGQQTLQNSVGSSGEMHFDLMTVGRVLPHPVSDQRWVHDGVGQVGLRQVGGRDVGLELSS